MIKYSLCFISGICICLIFFLFLSGYNKIRTPTSSTINVDTLHIDTIYIERDVQSVSFIGIGKLDTTISQIQIKIDTTGMIKIVDSIDNSEFDKYILPEFIVYFDTIINKDTFSLCYKFPLNLFDFNFAPHSDSIMFQQVTIEHKVIETKSNWLTTLAISTGVGILGYLVGSNRSK